MRKSLSPLLWQDYHRWPLWVPVGLASGSLLYFQLSFEPSLLLTLTVLCAGLALRILVYFLAKPQSFFHALFHELPFNFFLNGLLAIILGFSIAKGRTLWLDTVFLNEKQAAVEVTGILSQIDQPDSKMRRITLDQVTYQFPTSNPALDSTSEAVPSLLPLPTKTLPTKIRFKVSAARLEGFERDGSPPQLGDQIRCCVNIFPLSPPVSLQGYDFQRQAYFDGIGATGYALSPCQILKRAPQTQLYQARHHLTQLLRQHLPGLPGEIAAALITGDRSGIPQKTRQDFSDAGTAHILAISGLHVSLVSAIIFFLVRRGLALIPFLAEHYPIKKWAAIAAIFATGLYLAISGYSFPAQRAFMMTSLVMLGILADRNPLTMRSLALAATLILILYPESILSVSFQLSFAAVIGLVGFYETGARVLDTWLYSRPNHTWYRKLLTYGFGIMATTLIATLATTPIIIYHFNRVSLQAILGNLIGIPLTTLWIMPTAVIAIFSLSLGGVKWIFAILSSGIHLLIQSAEYVAALPGAAVLIPTPPPCYLIITVLGGLWLCLWQHSWRWFGAFLMVGALPLLLCDHHPTVYLAGDGSVIAYRHNKTLFVSSKKRGKFYYEQWAKELGGLKVKKFPFPNFVFKDTILLISDPWDFPSRTIQNICRKATAPLIVSNGFVWRLCRKFMSPQQQLIDRFLLKRHNSYFITLKDHSIKVSSLNELKGNRPWRISWRNSERNFWKNHSKAE